MACELENRMVIDAAWRWKEFPELPEAAEKLNGPGYESIDSGVFVPAEDAYEYALERIAQDEGLRQEFVEWFYSANWIKEG